MNHEIEAHFAQYCYLLKSEDDAQDGRLRLSMQTIEA